MKSMKINRGPSSIEANGELEVATRAVANASKDEGEKMEKSVALPAVQRKCKGNCSEENNRKEEQEGRNTYGFKTVCDIDIHPDDKAVVYPGTRRSFRVIGEGRPKVVPLLSNSDLNIMGPCEKEVYWAHEKVHVSNSSTNCAALKSCIEDNYDWLSSKISWDNWVACNHKHYKGLHPDCRADEHAAYTKSSELARKLAGETRCETEKSRLERLAIMHSENANKPPNCR